MGLWQSNEKQQIFKELNNKNTYGSAQFIMRYKYFTAQLIKYLFPKVYGQMALKEFIDHYMVNTNSSFLETLLTSDFLTNSINNREELLSIIRIPFGDVKKNLVFFLVYDTNANRNPLKEQSLRKRIKLTSWNLFRLQGKHSKLPYKEFCPVCVVWILPEKEDQPFKLEYWNDSRRIQFNHQITAEKLPLENNFIIRLGEPEDKENEEIAYFLNILFGEKQEKILELTEKLNIPLRSSEARDMKLFEVMNLLEEKSNTFSYDMLLSLGMPKRYDPAIMEVLELLRNE